MATLSAATREPDTPTRGRADGPDRTHRLQDTCKWLRGSCLPAIVEAIRNRQPVPDARLEALAEFTRQIVRERGWVSGTPTERFLAAGFSTQQALEVVLGVSLKTLSNYANHLVETPVNAEFASETWSRK